MPRTLLIVVLSFSRTEVCKLSLSIRQDPGNTAWSSAAAGRILGVQRGSLLLQAAAPQVGMADILLILRGLTHLKAMCGHLPVSL